MGKVGIVKGGGSATFGREYGNTIHMERGSPLFNQDIEFHTLQKGNDHKRLRKRKELCAGLVQEYM